MSFDLKNISAALQGVETATRMLKSGLKPTGSSKDYTIKNLAAAENILKRLREDAKQ